MVIFFFCRGILFLLKNVLLYNLWQPLFNVRITLLKFYSKIVLLFLKFLCFESKIKIYAVLNFVFLFCLCLLTHVQNEHKYIIYFNSIIIELGGKEEDWLIIYCKIWGKLSISFIGWQGFIHLPTNKGL